MAGPAAPREKREKADERTQGSRRRRRSLRSSRVRSECVSRELSLAGTGEGKKIRSEGQARGEGAEKACKTVSTM